MLTVWCPIPPVAQRRLRAGRVLRHGVQLLSEHADMLPPPSGRGVAGAPGGTVYPVAHLCPQPPPVPPVSVAACSYYDPRVDSAARCAAAEKSSGADLHAQGAAQPAAACHRPPLGCRLEAWLLWHLAVGVEHAFVYVLEGERLAAPLALFSSASLATCCSPR